jgi:hypothetical protein
MSHLMVKNVQSEATKSRSDSGGSGPTRQETPQAVLSVLAEIFERDARKSRAGETSSRPAAVAPDSDLHVPEEDDQSGRYDFDLAEFPLFRFYKNSLGRHGREPLIYNDTIRGREGEPVVREWKAYPGPFGFGGPSTQVLLYDLLQLYAEQGCEGSQLQFGTIRSLLHRRGERNPSKRDYERVRRDMDILRGYDFHCKNAFWDREKQAYVDMKWRLFGSVFYFKEAPVGTAEELPYGFIELSPVLQKIARSRGFFRLGFGTDLFYKLKPLEQRLAVYLAKKFTSQKVHRRFVEDLARALPIEASRPRDVRTILKETTQGLLDKRLPILRSYGLSGPREGRWLAEFVRSATPRSTTTRPMMSRKVGLDLELDRLVERVVEATGSPGDRPWWTQCVLRLGPGPVDRALGLLGDASRGGLVRNRGAFLTRIFKDLAGEAGIALR